MELPIKNKQQRRKLLKSAALGGGVLGASQLGTQWVKPVVDSVMLPAHASTTDDTGNLPPEATTAAPLQRYSFTDVGSQNGVMLAPDAKLELIASNSTTGNMIRDLFIPTAHAGIVRPPISTDTAEYYLGQISGDLYRFVSLRTSTFDGDVFRAWLVDGEISIGESKGLPQQDCGSANGTVAIELLSVVTGGDARVSIDSGELIITLNTDPGATPPQAPVCTGGPG